jgi:sugar lactone lactonase YvrE
VAVRPGGNLLATDPLAGMVAEFDSAGRLIEQRVGFDRPLGLAVDANGWVYLGEEGAGRVRVFDADWRPVYALGSGAGEFQLPGTIAVGSADTGPRVYVADGRANRVVVYVGATFERSWGGPGTGPSQFDFPSGLCLARDGTVWVVDQNNDRVQVFSAAGEFQRSFRLKTGGMGLGISGRAHGAALDSVGRLYVADAYQGLVKAFAADTGAFVGAVGAFGPEPGQLNLPVGLALDGQSRLWVASANNRRLECLGLDRFVHLEVEPPSWGVAAGETLTLRAVAGGPGPWVYRWFKNGTTFHEGTSSSLRFAPAGIADSGAYAVEVRDPEGSLVCGPVEVRVLAAPEVRVHPQGGLVLRGTPVLLSVTASGAPLIYQWHLDGRDIPGATNATLAFDGIQTTQAGSYSVSVANPVGTVLSEAARVEVLVPPEVMEMLPPLVATNGSFRLTLNADPGYVYALDATVDFGGWLTLTNFWHPGGLADYVDPDAGGTGLRFYRLRWVP